jgi:hypothetical protein
MVGIMFQYHVLFFVFECFIHKIFTKIYDNIPRDYEEEIYMLTTDLFRLQANHPRTFAVMMSKRQRSKLVKYLNDLESSGISRTDDKKVNKLIYKLENGHMSYDNNELNIMRAAIILNRFVEPISFICKRYIARAISRSAA